MKSNIRTAVHVLVMSAPAIVADHNPHDPTSEAPNEDPCRGAAQGGYRSLSLSNSEHHPAGGRERSSAAWSGGHPRRPVAVFRHRAVAAAKPSGNPPSLARVRRGGAQGVALTPGSVRSRRCHTCPSARLRVFNAQHQDSTRTQYRVRKLTIR